MHNLDCYIASTCYQNAYCPLYVTCQQIRYEEEEKFLGDIENWKPTGLQQPEEGK